MEDASVASAPGGRGGTVHADGAAPAAAGDGAPAGALLPGLGYGDAAPSAAERELRRRAHAAIPGGTHTAAKGDDQFPERSPAFIARGKGCRVWDTEGREYVEYALGLRSTTLGHAWPSVNAAAAAALELGNNFNRPSALEVECAERFLELVPAAEMVKFTKDGSTVMTAAVKLARAWTGRDLVALCRDSPFFSYDDWFIGTTPIASGTLPATVGATLRFGYNDLASLEALFDAHEGRIACVAMEPARQVEPEPGFLEGVRALCDRRGAVLILDETVTGFRWHRHGAQHVYGITPDLSCFGKAMANGFSLSALAGRREIMELGGIRQTARERVFLLSTTHGAEGVALAAAAETMRIYRDEPVTEHLERAGARLRAGIEAHARAAGLERHVTLSGRGCALVFATLDDAGRPSQALRSLLLQELLRHGVLAPSLMPAYAHADADLDHTIAAFGEALGTYRRALEDGVEHHLVGPPGDVVYRPWNRDR